MSKFSLWLRIPAWLLAAALVACGGTGGSSPPPAGGIVATPGNGQVTITWTPTPGVEYWLMYAATATPIDIKNPPPGHIWASPVTSPYVVTGLTNGTTYSFALNGRTGGGPGGAQTPSVSAVPAFAGSTWIAGTAAGTNDLNALTYGTTSSAATSYVAAGTAGALYKATDGTTWTAITTGPSIDFKSLGYVFGKFIGAGSNGVGNNIFSSTDLVTWTAATTTVATGINAMASNGTTLVAVGDGATAYKSTDGASWTAVPLPGGVTANLYGIAYSASGLWVVVGQSGTVITSPDLSTWTVQTSNAGGNDLHGVTATSGNVWVAVGSAGTVIRSADGLTWVAQTLGTTPNLLAVNTDSAQFLAVGQTGAAFTSTDGSTWTAVTTGATANLNAIYGNASRYLVVGQGGGNLSSK